MQGDFALEPSENSNLIFLRTDFVDFNTLLIVTHFASTCHKLYFCTN